MLNFVRYAWIIFAFLVADSAGRVMTATLYKCESGPHGTRSNKLIPYFSAAVPDGMQRQFPFGTIVFVKQFRGARLRTGGRHSGYFRIDDICKGSCWVKADGGWDWYPVLDIHVGRNGWIGSGASKITVQKVQANSKTLEQRARRYSASRC